MRKLKRKSDKGQGTAQAKTQGSTQKSSRKNKSWSTIFDNVLRTAQGGCAGGVREHPGQAGGGHRGDPVDLCGSGGVCT